MSWTVHWSFVNSSLIASDPEDTLTFLNLGQIIFEAKIDGSVDWEIIFVLHLLDGLEVFLVNVDGCFLFWCFLHEFSFSCLLELNHSSNPDLNDNCEAAMIWRGFFHSLRSLLFIFTWFLGGIWTVENVFIVLHWVFFERFTLKYF